MSDPLWTPNFNHHTPLICDFIDLVNVRYGQNIARDDFQALHAWSVNHKAEFWDLLWDFCGVEGDKGARIIAPIDDPPFARFFPDGQLSYAENMLSYWIDHPEEPAIIHRHQGGNDRILTGKTLCDSVSVCEQALRRAGIGKGDVVSVYLPNIPETDIILLAASNIGAILCTAGMEMGTDDVIGRFGAAAPKILFTAQGYSYGDKWIDRSATITAMEERIPSLERVVYFDLQNHGIEGDFLNGLAPQPLTFTRHDFNHPLYILFSSGSTGVPKCFVHGSGGILLKHLCEYQLHADVQAGDRSFFHATPSWMMWNWAASSLAVGAVNLKYTGNPFYPDAGAQLRFTAAHHCTHHGTAAPVIMGWRDQGLSVKDDLDLSDLRCVLYTGAVLPEQGFTYLDEHVKTGMQIFGISGGTDIVGCFIYGNPITPVYAGEIAGPTLGIDLQIWDDDGAPVGGEDAGELVIVGEFPSMPLYFLGDDGTRYRDAYYDFYADKGHQVWRHGDTVRRTHNGQIVIIGRSDGTLNQNGVRIGSIVIYNQLEPFKERITGATAVDFTRPDTKQSITILFLAMPDYTQGVPEDLVKAIKSAIRNNVGPYSVPSEIIAAPDVLRTKNGKLAEVVTKKILAGTHIPNADLYGADLVCFYEGIAKDLAAKYSA